MEPDHYPALPWGNLPDACPVCEGEIQDLRGVAFNKDQVGACFMYTDKDIQCVKKAVNARQFTIRNGETVTLPNGDRIIG